MAQAGDISSIAVEGAPLTARFFIECKDYAALNLGACFYRGTRVTVACWDTPLQQARAVGKSPLCIVKELRRQELVLGTAETFAEFNVAAGGRLPLRGTFRRDDGMVHVWHLHDLLVLCSPDALFRRVPIARELL